MNPTTQQQISLYQEAKTSLNSLLQQTTQLGVCFLVMLLITGGNPPTFTIKLSIIIGIGFVAWKEKKRLTKQQLAREKEEIQKLVKQILEADTENLSELIKTAGFNPLTDFVGANLFAVKGIGCNLNGYNLSYADLSAADLSRTDLSEANLMKTNLCSAKLSRAYLMNTNLSHALLINADLSYADLRNADLSNANLINANVSNADLSGANLTATNISNLKVKNTLFSNNLGLTDNVRYILEKQGAIFPHDELVTIPLSPHKYQPTKPK
ncbi:pentapeptide repeat-containing protein [Anabaena cylindrica UHCC 0172]|uniref:pentapeptide repeat-containing protein n=1 Tax=Anabaena cylindrica TaxID=1165 RepID=UPI002B210BB1|nr:pentapeptide repeat-containing protein [Anabaena cylindrica]MEA5551048.1 pentapeptide repeat-containing protein [Anabaena cylindrica UHCC 0172]